MKNRIFGSILVLLGMAIFSSAALAQAPEFSSQKAPPKSKTPAPSHDPHDLNGVWLAGGGVDGGGQQKDLAPAAVRTQWMKAPLPVTAEGAKVLGSNHGGKGPRSLAPSLGNDPMGNANPPGLVRTLVYGRPVQFISLPNEMVNLFEWYHYWRQLWMDGRKLPDDPDALWYGTSVAKWDGDVFAVDTVGLDNRAWLDEWGAPFSDSMHLTERWHRLDRDNMELTITVADPKFYSRTWTSDKKTFVMQPAGTPDGEIQEVIFAPWDEQDFNRRIRDANPVVGGQQK